MQPGPQHHHGDDAERSRTSAKARESQLHALETALHRRGAILAAVGFAAEQFLGDKDWEASVREVLDRVEAHGGHIWVESRLKEGSTSYFTIPTAAD